MASPTFITEMIALVRQRAYLPVAGGPSNTAITRDLNAELLTYVTPLLISTGNERFVRPYPFTTTADEAEYDIPTSSIGGDFRDVQVRTATDPDVWISLPHTEPERAPAYDALITPNWPMAYYIRDNAIVLVPIPAAGTSMRFLEYLRPRQLTVAYTTVTAAIGGGTVVLTVPSTSGMVDGDFDVLDSTTYEALAEDCPGVVTNATTLTFTTSELTTDQYDALVGSAGDTILQSGTVPIAEIPQEAAILLCLRAAAIQLQEQSDPRAQGVLAEVGRVRQALLDLFQPRASGLGRKVVNYSAPGWGARSWGYNGRYWGG